MAPLAAEVEAPERMMEASPKPNVAPSIRSSDQHKLQNVQVLRGVAAAAVVFYHLGLNGRVRFPAALPIITSYGKFGVQAFFVLSGFILPWSMARAAYRISDFGRFILKRFLRLDPAYLCSIILSIAFIEAAAGEGGSPANITVFQVLAHLGYLNVFLHMPWLNPVYWTLAIEMQFYIFIALVFPILNGSYRFFIFAGMAIAPLLLRNQYFLPHHMSLFLLGIGVYLWKSQSADRRIAIGWLVGAVILVCLQLAPSEAIGGFAGAVVLSVPTIRGRWLVWLGELSFSLYLVHYHVGNKVQSLIAPYLPWFVVYVIGLSAALTAAYILYRFVELPSQRWASAVRYAHRKASPKAPGAASGAA
jgi:peptidoglycan/LPS O-acetylase OafA/YrhL